MGSDRNWWDKTRSGMNSIPIVGGLTSSIFGDPDQEDHQANLERAQAQINGYRPQAMQGRMNAMNQGALAFGPLNQLMGQMYGKGAMQNMKPMMQNPMDPNNNSYRSAFGANNPMEGVDPRLANAVTKKFGAW